MKYCIEMYVGTKRLMLVSFHKTHLEASLKIAEYALEDRANGKSCYRYEIVRL
jgi:hypothetical protein